MHWWRPSPEKRFRRDKYADWFAHFDRNDNGVLDPSDFEAYAAATAEVLGLDPADASVERLRDATRSLWAAVVGPMDASGDGVVRLDELVGCFVTLEQQVAAGQALPSWARELVQALFAVLDVDETGDICLGEYRTYLRTLGAEADPAESFASLDADGDGRIPFEEIERLFLDWLTVGRQGSAGNLLLTGREPS